MTVESSTINIHELTCVENFEIVLKYIKIMSEKQLPHMLPMLPFFTSWAAKNSTCGGSTANCPVDSLGWLRNQGGQIIPCLKKIIIAMSYNIQNDVQSCLENISYVIPFSHLSIETPKHNPKQHVQKALFWTEPTRRCFCAPGGMWWCSWLVDWNVVKDGKTSENYRNI